MRVIVFLDIPGQIASIPFDVVGDPPVQEVLKNMLLFSRLAAPADSGTKYRLFKNGAVLAHDRPLSQSAVRNGDHLELRNADQELAFVLSAEAPVAQTQPATIEQAARSIKPTPGKHKVALPKRSPDEQSTDEPKPAPATKSQRPPVPGKKIDPT